MAKLTKEQLHILQIINSENLEPSPASDRFWAQLIDLCQGDVQGNHPTDAESLYATGAENLKHIRKFWQTAFDAIEAQCVNWREYLANFKFTANDIVATAAQTLDCNLVSHWKTSVVDGLIPQCPIETIPLQRQTTTFHNCGWCTHAIAKSIEFHTDAFTKGYCRLLGPDLLKFTSCKEACHFTNTTSFDPKLVEKRIQHAKDLLEQKIQKAGKLQEAIRLRLNILDEATKKAPQDRPLYPSWRGPSYFECPKEDLFREPESTSPETSRHGCEIVCFLKLGGQVYITAHGYVREICPGKTAREPSTIYVRCEIRPGYYPECDFRFGPTSPLILDRAGFNYFYEHPEDLSNWLRESRTSTNGAPDDAEIDNLVHALLHSGRT